MTIKQHGGVFGRNPSFNDVSVKTLSIAGTDLASTAAELNILDGVTATTAELNILDGVTATTAELNILDGVTSTTAELNILDGVTADATELNYLDGASTSAVVASKAVVANSSGNIAFPDSKGIDFSATANTGTSELFDDYEEGSWTPALAYDTVGTSSFTYVVQAGYYTKMGRSVTVYAKLQLSAFTKGTASGSLNVTGLPYTAITGEPLSVSNLGLFDTPFSDIPIVIVIPGNSLLRFLTISDNAGWANISDPDNNSQYMFTATYFV